MQVALANLVGIGNQRFSTKVERASTKLHNTREAKPDPRKSEKAMIKADTVKPLESFAVQTAILTLLDHQTVSKNDKYGRGFTHLHACSVSRRPSVVSDRFSV
ncbi:unnamed protein product [Sphenostylis stenocarpa]|uniref:Uncharacterized protein n=1 Tax=Sphenostylis stenocarpa TaxID=92480 RepID=A0AA86RX86_9FABA|nr:unnamed protein product [Sphenostylis stenocarpa]